MLQLKLHAAEDKGPFISAHRGHSAKAPENTLPALEAALMSGAHVAEIDVKLTKDGHLVLMHDDEVDRTTDGEGPVWELTLDEIGKLDAGRWFDRKYARTKVPTLDEVLAWSKGRVVLEPVDLSTLVDELLPLLRVPIGPAVTLPLDQKPSRHRLHASCGQPRHDLLPQHRGHAVPVEPVDDAPGLLRVNQGTVDLARVGDGLPDRGRGDLVEDHPPYRDPRLEHLEQVPGDCLALAVLISREQ